MHNGNYLLVASVPVSMHNSADMVLAAGLISGPVFLADFVASISPWIALLGGIMGLFIGSVRVYEIIKGLLHKKQISDDE